MKAFNTMYYRRCGRRATGPVGTLVLFIAARRGGEGRCIEAHGRDGFEPVDTGSLGTVGVSNNLARLSTTTQ